MSKTGETTGVDLTSLGEIIANGIAKGIAAMQPPKELREGDPEYVAEMRRQGLYDDFDVPVYQHGFQAQARGETAQTRFRASRLKTGNYIDYRGRKRVEVRVEASGAVHINYPVTGDAMRINDQLFPTFEALINRIWEEMYAPVDTSAPVEPIQPPAA